MPIQLTIRLTTRLTTSLHVIWKNEFCEKYIWQIFSSVCQSVVCNSATPWTAAHLAYLSITNLGVCSNSCPSSWRCHSTISFSVIPFSSCLQSFPASGPFPMCQFFTSGGQNIAVSASNDYSGLISFRNDWFDLLAVQWTLKSLFQPHSSNASILWHSAFFIVQLSHPYMITGKTRGLTSQTFVDRY